MLIGIEKIMFEVDHMAIKTSGTPQEVKAFVKGFEECQQRVMDWLRLEKELQSETDPHMKEEKEQEPVSAGEDRDFICRQLAKLLQHTRAGSGIRDITRSQETPHADEFATIKYSNGYNQFVNITADSGIGIIKDICKAI